MKDELDTSTNDAFLSLEELERQDRVMHCLSTGGHYQAVAPSKVFEITGRRYNGTKTPDSVRDLWSTHREVIAWMVSQYGEYDLDAAASDGNKVCDKFFSEKTNCLTRWWGKDRHIWLNPPYSFPDPFVLKAIEQMEHGNQIDILLPGDNSTAWFADCAAKAAEIIWIISDNSEVEGVKYSRSGRLAFVSGETGKPVDGNNKGSVIFIMRELKEGETQKTRYVPISEICPSVMKKRNRARKV